MYRANRTIEVNSPPVFWVINGSDENLVWRTNFKRVNLSIDGEADDFNNTNYRAFQVSELQLLAFSGYIDRTFFCLKKSM